MPGDETVFEAPVTPAPLFAYRAIRSIFFASPESSPEHENKENIAPVSVVASPVKSKCGAGEESTPMTPSQKRKRMPDGRGAAAGDVLLSPMKGILRTPGQATPRAKYLKDVNVKFKSVSPEVAVGRENKVEAGRRENVIVPVHGSSKTQHQNPPQAQRPSKPKSRVTTLETVSQGSDPPKQKHPGPESMAKSESIVPASEAEALSSAAIEAYVQQTEKEMKRLVRYGQKMREYARKQDAENQELKLMIEQLQRENARLKKESVTASRLEKEEDGQHKVSRERMGKDEDAIVGKKIRGYVREGVDQVEATVRGHPRHLSFPPYVPEKGEGRDEVPWWMGETRKTNRSSSQNPSLNLNDASGKLADTRTKHSSLKSSAPSSSTAATSKSIRQPMTHSTFNVTSTTNPPPTRSNLLPIQQPSTSTPKGALPTLAPFPNPEAEAEADAGPAPSAGTGAGAGAGSIRLPPDRLAAARERLRRRTEARKASSSTTANVDPNIEEVLIRPFAEQQRRSANANASANANGSSSLKRNRNRGVSVSVKQAQVEMHRTTEGGRAAREAHRDEPSEVDWANL